MHALKLHESLRLSTVRAVIALSTAACIAPQRTPDTVVYASGTDLESGNPLVTVHSLSRQIQRFALFVTLAKYNSVLEPIPYAARAWEWSGDHRRLTLHLVADIRWHDGKPTTARDVAFTINAARNPEAGFWRATDLATVDSAAASDDSTAVVHFSSPPPSFPLIFCELPILPSHLLSQWPLADMRRAPFNLAPVGNGPF